MMIAAMPFEPRAVRLERVSTSSAAFAFASYDGPGFEASERFSALSKTESSTVMRPVVVENLFGWFAPGTKRRGVILCGTLGFEQLSAYRGWRELGDRIAATGCATLRFDYPGEGDSGDLDDGAGRVAAWIAAIHRAIAHLREAAEVEEIVLVGLRFGATLAALAAQAGGVDRLVLLAPFAGGRPYLREMTLRSSTIDTLPDGTPFPKTPGLLTLGGFHLGPDLVGELAGIALDPASSAPVPNVLLLGDAAGLAARYEASGSTVSRAPFPGLAQLVSKPLFSETPEAAFSEVVAFVADGARARPNPLRPSAPAGRVRGSAWTEEAVRFGPGLFGILCRPHQAEGNGPVVLFVNSGTNVRWGYGRQTTALARRLAATGIASLRIDLRGVGDSVARPDGALPLYNLAALDDLGAAIDHLAGLEAGPVVVVGCCSGAHLVFHATCRDPRIAAAVLVNLHCFDWNPKDDVETTLRKPFRSAATYAALIRRGCVWRRILRNEVRVAAILNALTRTVLSRLGGKVADLIRPGRTGGTVAARLRALRRRGARLHLVYSAGEPGLAEVRTHLGRSQARAAAILGRPVSILENADHNLSVAGAPDGLFRILEDLIADLTPVDRGAGA